MNVKVIFLSKPLREIDLLSTKTELLKLGLSFGHSFDALATPLHSVPPSINQLTLISIILAFNVIEIRDVNTFSSGTSF